MTNKLQQIGQKKVNTVPLSKTSNVTKINPKLIQKDSTTEIIKNLILSAVQSLEMIHEEGEAQKEIYKKLEDDFGYSPKVSRKVAKLIHKQNKPEVDQLQMEADALYSKISP